MAISQVINVIVNSRGAVTVARELNAMGDAARETTTYLNGLRAVLAAALTFSGIGAIVEVVDTFTVLQNRLKQVATEQNTVSDSWERLLGIANQSYSTIEGTVDLYFKVAQAYKAWGESAEEAYEFTDLFQKAAILSGSSMQTTSQAVYQFSQALNKGKLDGDEFRSVLEGLPYVATLIQNELGVTRAELYKMSADGKISLDRIKDAFENAAAAIRGDWANVTPTIGMALVVFKNQWTDFIGDIQTGTGIFTAVAWVIIGVAHNFDLLALALTPVAAAMVWLGGRLAMGAVVIAFKDFINVLRTATATQWLFNAAVYANPWTWVIVAIVAVVAAIVYFRNEIGLTNEVLASLWAGISGFFSAIGSGLMSVWNSIVGVVKRFEEWSGLFAAIARVSQTLWNAIKTGAAMVADAIGKFGAYLQRTLMPIWEGLIELVNEFWELIKDVSKFISDVFAKVWEEVKQAWDAFYEPWRPQAEFMWEVAKTIVVEWTKIQTFFSGAFFDVIKKVFEGWVFLIDKVIEGIKYLISLLRTAIKLMSQVTGGGGGGGGGGGAHYGAQFQAEEGFATGGRFRVGGTGVGRDTTPVAFRAERGERVTVETKKQQRIADASQGGQAPSVNVPVQIVNVIDPSMVVNANQTSAGMRSIVNAIKLNRDEIAAELGVA